MAAGQAYFVSDDRPVNSFEFFRPLVEGLGYTYPWLRLPLSLMYALALLAELVHGLVSRVHNFQPFLTRSEVLKSGVNHWFSIDKARIQLGYRPQHYSFDDIVGWFTERGHGRLAARKEHKWSRLELILSILVCIAALWFGVATSSRAIDSGM